MKLLVFLRASNLLLFVSLALEIKKKNLNVILPQHL